ncbi:MAG: glycosyl transferase, partial [Nocardioides sp.]|nr:glycosyl transferase [Nocardioides sp.]
QLALGYNGLGRITGNQTTSFSNTILSAANIARISRTDIAGEIIWLLPAAVVLGIAGFWLVRARPDSTPLRAGLVMWFVWLSVAGLTFASMAGISHSYYTVVLAPALAALVAIGGWTVWQDRVEHLARTRALIVAASAVTTVLSVALLVMTGSSLAWVAVLVLMIGSVPVILLVRPDLALRPIAATAVCALVAGALGPVAFSLATSRLPHTGSGPMAGPNYGASTTELVVSTGVLGGLTGSRAISPGVVTLLTRGARHYTWAAAALGAPSASSYELATGASVLAIGGYTGADPLPSLTQFKQWVHEGRIHYFLPGGTSGGTGKPISDWVANAFRAHTIDGVTYYDLSG